MEAISWTNGTWGMSHHGLGHGPWIMADLENGLFSNNPLHGPSQEKPILGARYVTAMLKGDAGNHWALKGGDATVADDLETLYDGDRPCTMRHEIDCENHQPNYNPMRKQASHFYLWFKACHQKDQPSRSNFKTYTHARAHTHTYCTVYVQSISSLTAYFF